MTVDRVQRWHGGRDSYRPAGEPIVTSAYEVAAIDTEFFGRFGFPRWESAVLRYEE